MHCIDNDEEETPSKKKATPRKPKTAGQAKTDSDGENITMKAEPNEAGEAMDNMT